MRYSIRGASSADAVLIQALLDGHGLPSSDFHPHLDAFVVAVTPDKRIVGSAGVELYPDVGLLRSVAVEDRHRGQGIGRQLTEAALHLAWDRGLSQVYLLTETADTFFARHGFVAVERTDVPAAIGRTAAFTTHCSAQAVVMSRSL